VQTQEARSNRAMITGEYRSVPPTERRCTTVSNIDTMREGYARYSARDFSFVDEIFAPDINWRVPVGEPIVGREGVKEFFNGLTEMFSAHSITCDDYVEDGDRLVCFVQHHLTTPDGRTADIDAVHDWRWRDGQVTSLNETADTLTFAIVTGQVPAPAAA
jgi:ketosteroid isomerase-like protein